MPGVSGFCLEPFEAPPVSSTAVTTIAFLPRCRTGIFIETLKISPLPTFFHLMVYTVHGQKSQATLSQNQVLTNPLEVFLNKSMVMLVEASLLSTSLVAFLLFLYST